MSTVALSDVAADLGVSERWLRGRVRELAVPHLVLGRRIRLTAEQHADLLAALTRGPAAPTSRSLARQRRRAA